MPNFASVFKQEVTRLAKKEARAATNSLKEQLAKSRKQVAELRTEVRALNKKVESLLKHQSSASVIPFEEADEETSFRFSPKSVRAHRKRVGMSAEQYAKLLGVSMQTVYHWEQGKSRPRKSQMATLGAVRKLGKKEAARRLATVSRK